MRRTLALLLAAVMIPVEFVAGTAAAGPALTQDGPLPFPAYDPAAVANQTATVGVSSVAMGGTPGNFSVGDAGTAEYSIPLQVVAGRGGFQPELSLHYSSDNGNGPLGKGFALRGLSQISRCAKTIADDSVAEGPRFVETDRFCLDGRRLALVSGTYGADGAEYRTIPDSHVRVRSFRPADTPFTLRGPIHFTVQTAEGITQTYGTDGTTASVPVAIGRANATWSLARAENRAGNAIVYKYATRTVSATDPTEVERWLTSIEYGDAGKLDRRVEFEYQTRPDPWFGYAFGQRRESLRRLFTVRMSIDAGGFKQARSYNLRYQNDGSTKISKLDRMFQCGTSTTDCRRPTEFTWSLGSPGFGPALTQTSTTQSLVPSTATSQLVSADLTGDGRTDLAWPEADGWRYMAAQPGPASARYRNHVNAGGAVANGTKTTGHPIDFDLDGRVDLIQRTPDHSDWRPLLTRPGLTVQRVRTAYLGGLNHENGPNTNNGFFGDFNGDGYQDVLEHRDSGWSWRQRSGAVGVLGNDPDNPEKVAFGTSIQLPDLTTAVGPQDVMVIDLDGDGRDEVVYRVGLGATQVLDPARPELTHPIGTPFHRPMFDLDIKQMDVNGDGLTDVVTNGRGISDGTKEDQLYYRLNTGGGFLAPVAMGIALTAEALPISEVVDADSDGRQDLLVPRRWPDSPTVPVYSGMDLVQSGFVNGSPSFTKSATQINFALRTAPMLTGQGFRAVDADGDSLDDLVFIDRSDTTEDPVTLKLYTHAGDSANRKPDLLTSIREGDQHPTVTDSGVPATVRINYAPLSDTSVYEPGTCGSLVHVSCLAGEGRYLVQQVRRDAAAEGQISLASYEYKDGRVDKRSQRFLGFAERRVITNVAGQEGPRIERFFSTNTSPRQDPRLVEQWTARSLPNGKQSLTRTNITWAKKTTTGTFFDFVADTRQRNYEFPTQCCLGSWTRAQLDSQGLAFFRQSSSSYLVDSFGNVTRDRTATGADQTVTTVDTSYDIDTTNWLVARPKRIVIADAARPSPAEPLVQQVRTTEFSYQPGHTRVAQRKTFGSDASPGRALTTDHGYDASGNLVRISQRDVTSGELREATAVFDPQSFPHATMNALGHVTRTGYDPVLGLPKVTVDPNGLRTDTTYDTLGQRRLVRLPSGAEQTIGYAVEQVGDEFLRRVTTSDGTGAQTQSVVDRAGRVQLERFKGFDGKTRERESNYDARGNLVLRTDFRTAGSPITQTRFSHDDLGRIVQRTAADGGVRRWAYDDLSTTETDARGNRRLAQTDQRGLVVRQIDGLGSTAEARRINSYGPFGNLLSSQTEGIPASRGTFSYDEFGNPIASTDPERGSSTGGYNAFGELVSSRDANGRESTLSYDLLGRLTKKSVQQSGVPRSILTSRYDDDGTRTRKGMLMSTGLVDFTAPVTGGTAAAQTGTEFFYDSLSRVNHVIHMMPVEDNPSQLERLNFLYEHDTFGRTTSVFYPKLTGQVAGTKVMYDYATTNGRLNRTRVDQGEVLWTAKATDDRDRLTVEESGDGVTTSQQFDALGRTTAQTHRKSATDVAPSEMLLSHSYGYDQEGNLLQRNRQHPVQGLMNETFGYDPLDRVITARVNFPDPCPPEGCVELAPAQIGFDADTWSYDKLGNIVSSRRRGTFGYNPAKPTQVTSVTGGTFGAGSYGYDAVGNQTVRPDGQVAYNDFNLPVRITSTKAGGSASFQYYPTGERARKVSSSGTTTYVPGLYERQRVGTRTEHRFLVQADGRAVAALRFNHASSVANAVKLPTLHLHDDRLGSTNLVTQNEATTGFKAVVKEERSYDAFGSVRNPDWRTDNAGYTQGLQPALVDRGYTGHDDDRELGLINMTGRVYDPQLGRFLTPDPFVNGTNPTQAWNRYAYVGNNPLGNTDPTGFVTCADCTFWDEGGWSFGSGDTSGMGDGGGYGGGATGREDLDRFRNQGDRRFYDTSGVPGAVEVQELFEPSYEINRGLGRHDAYVQERKGQLDAIDQLRERQERAQSGPAEWKEKKSELQRQSEADPAESEDGARGCTCGAAPASAPDWQKQADAARSDFEVAGVIFAFGAAAFGAGLALGKAPGPGALAAPFVQATGGWLISTSVGYAVSAAWRLVEAKLHGAY